VITWTLALLSAGLGLWSDTEDRRRPQRWRMPASLLNRVLYAQTVYRKEPVQRQLLGLLGSLSRGYGEKLKAVFAEAAELHQAQLEPLEPASAFTEEGGRDSRSRSRHLVDAIKQIALWRMMPEPGYRDLRLEPHVLWFARELNRAYKRGLKMRASVLRGEVEEGSALPEERPQTLEMLGVKNPDDIPHAELSRTAREIAGKWSQIFDWVDANNVQLQDKTWQDAIAESDAWHEGGFANEGTFRGPVVPGVPIMVWPDGSRLDRLLTAEQLGQEGASMDHCVGGYWKYLRDNVNAIYSLRGPDLVPYMTLSFEIPASRGSVNLEEYKGPKNEAIDNATALANARGMEALLRGAGVELTGDRTAVGMPVAIITDQELKTLEAHEKRFSVANINNSWRADWEHLAEELSQLKRRKEEAEEKVEELEDAERNIWEAKSAIREWEEELEVKGTILRQARNSGSDEDIEEAEQELEDAREELEGARTELEENTVARDELNQEGFHIESVVEIESEIDDTEDRLQRRREDGPDIDFSLGILIEKIEEVTGLEINRTDRYLPFDPNDIEEMTLSYKVYGPSGAELLDLEVQPAANLEHEYLYETNDYEEPCDHAKSDTLIGFLIQSGALKTTKQKLEELPAVLPAWAPRMSVESFLTDNRTFAKRHGTGEAYGRTLLQARPGRRDIPRLLGPA
jgi:hypothetical protein